MLILFRLKSHRPQHESLLVTFRPKQEVVRFAENITGVKSYVEALRAQMHEFNNKLQVVSGLVQAQNYTELETYIHGVVHLKNRELQQISGKIGDYIDTDLNERLLTILSTKENVNLQTLGFESDIHATAALSPRSILQERDLARCLCTGWKMTIRSTILYWLNTEQQSLVWR